jgi:hypothetical protein
MSNDDAHRERTASPSPAVPRITSSRYASTASLPQPFDNIVDLTPKLRIT